jgi:hypothetical protein
MATTTPREWEGEPTLTPEVLAAIGDMYRTALGDMDKASDGDDASYYEGWSDGLAYVLDLLYGVERDPSS